MAAVLVVEDEAQVLVLTQSYLEEQGHKVFSATTVEGAQAVLAQEDKIDILIKRGVLPCLSVSGLSQWETHR